MRHIRYIVAYDGTDLAGYQKQPDDKGLTVQGCLKCTDLKLCMYPCIGSRSTVDLYGFIANL